MRLAINICLWAIAIASGIMFVISTIYGSTEAAHGWNVIFISSVFLSVFCVCVVQTDRLLSKIARFTETVGSETDQVQVEKDLELADRQVRLTKQGGYHPLVGTVVVFGLAILGRWLGVRGSVLFFVDLMAIFLLQMTILCFVFSALQRRLASLYRRLAQPTKEEEPADSE